MRISPLHAQLAAASATFAERHGVEVVPHFAPNGAEYAAIRDAVGLTDFSFVRQFKVPEDAGLDFLDRLVAGNVPKIRFGRVLHTFMADTKGHLVADCYVANNDTEFIFLCESIVSDAELDQLFQSAGEAEAAVEELTGTHVLLSLDGFKAWEVAKELFGADVLGLPYLSIEVYPFEGDSIRLFRAGKTSEFGYLLLAPISVAPALFDTLKNEVQKRGGQLCGVNVHNDLRLEGRFFNIHAEGSTVRDPLPLGLQWMIDFEKEDFQGSEPIRERRESGLKQKIIGLASEAGCQALQRGASVFHEGRPVADVVASCHSGMLNQRVALALFPVELAYSGLQFSLSANNGPLVRSISMPPIMPKSLSVKLDEM